MPDGNNIVRTIIYVIDYHYLFVIIHIADTMRILTQVLVI